jgi:hypothetical protein
MAKPGSFVKNDPRFKKRKKRSQNKLTTSFKELVQETYEALEESGHGMEEWATQNKTEFYRIAAKLIPTQIAGDINVNVIKVIRE